MADGIIPDGVEGDGGPAGARQDPRGRAAAAGFLSSYRRFVEAQLAYVHEDRPPPHSPTGSSASDLLKISMQWPSR